MPKFLTVKEAAALVGKSPSSVRRIIYPIVKDDQHPDRKHIEPGPDEAQTLRQKGDNFAWKISEELLKRQVPDATEKGSGPSRSSDSSGTDQTAIIEMLRKELEIKNQQITTQNDLLKGLSERLHEGNVLIGSLQQQLALTDGSTRRRSEASANGDTATESEKGSRASQPPATKKRRFFGRLFH